jgi:hypothetical protein
MIANLRIILELWTNESTGIGDEKKGIGRKWRKTDEK